MGAPKATLTPAADAADKIWNIKHTLTIFIPWLLFSVNLVSDALYCYTDSRCLEHKYKQNIIYQKSELMHVFCAV